MPCLKPTFALAALLGWAGAQSPPTPPPTPGRGQRLIEVTRAGPDQVVWCSSPTQHGAAPARTGGLFVLVTRATYAKGAAAAAGGGAGGEQRGSDLELWRSDDRGFTWRHAASAPTRGDGNGVVIPDGDLLSCLWSSRHGTEWSNVFWQRFDPAQNQWLGTPTPLALGSSTNDQYHASDLARGDDGGLLAAIGNQAEAVGPAFRCSWSTGMRWLGAGRTDWSPLQQVNVSSYGCCASAMARGHLVDLTYRTCPNEAIHGLRSIDLRDGSFVQQNDENAACPPAPEQFVANVGVLCRDDTGGRSLLHLLGDHVPGRGRLALSWSRPGEPTVTTAIAEDPPLQAGNENPQHYTLARGPGSQVFAYFSKASEAHRQLWQCVVEEGRPVGQAQVVATGDDSAFVVLSGQRSSAVSCGLRVVTLGRTAALPGGLVSVFGSWPAATSWSANTRD
jgi:hypothetical protein